MNSCRIEIDKWLIEGIPADDGFAASEEWDPVFDAGRHLVYIKFGPFWRLYLRPERFIKRFYHRVYPLPIEHWRATQQLTLYDGFCSIDVTLEIHFQATLKYALNNMTMLAELNEHIKTSYKDLIINLVDKELLGLSDGAWVQKGVTDIEKRISLAIAEMLILQNIQSQTLCTIKPEFNNFPDVQLAQKNVYLCVLKKSFESNRGKREELFRQEQETEKQTQEHKQKLLEQLNHDAELERQKQALEALHKKLLLEEQEKQQLKQFEIEKRLYAEKVKHENALKEIAQEAQIQEQQKQEARLRIAEQKKQAAFLVHQNILKEKELEADVAIYEKQEAKWRESKNKVHELQLALEQRQKQLEVETNLKNQKNLENIQKEIYNKRMESDKFLRKEIESLALEKQHLELQLAIKDAKKQMTDNKKTSKASV